ncbi:branched-chain amino acid ABC transporter substrate-binding protein [Pigmentiphaga sp. NML080357]|uniref:ABC transporter substrate-binding protein n=1 Tax=Pigmentiphaga sp. NML080357 TaxID=2008675 RepID=UPI000B41C653|nr:ABC transporter substrate-binding protein [Pigmentiphaga sp. NML080357]OVZ54369.1 branched-chain amino acid ABC transporter substrate-binding protein [Pigmentiphaga sp. NML080357]
MKTLIRRAMVAAAVLCAAQVQAATIKVGIIGPFSGPFAHYGKLYKDSVEAYLATQGGKLAGHEVQVLYRDNGGPNPSGTRALAQELIVKDKVDYLGGFVFTPNAMSVAPLITQSKTPTVIFNAATSDITEKSPYFVRTSYTLWQVTVPAARWAYKQGKRKIVTAVTDYAPGVDAETAFKTEFAKLGGTVVESIRMPISTTDFAPFVQRIKASGAEGVYVFLPGGPPNLGFVKAYNENGLRAAGVEFLGSAETDEFDLQKFGDAAMGLTTVFHYSAAHDSDANRKFVAALQKQSKDAIANYASVGAWDGMYVIQKMIEATGGKRDGAAALEAARKLSWESPRGPVKIDPQARHVTQNVYLRKVERSGGLLVNKEIESFGPQPDFGLKN